MRAVNRSIRKGQDLSNSIWVSNIVVETCLPALGLVLIGSSSIDVAYQPLANPAILVFSLFIILSVLRLNPTFCRVSGLVAATSYLIA